MCFNYYFSVKTNEIMSSCLTTLLMLIQHTCFSASHKQDFVDISSLLGIPAAIRNIPGVCCSAVPGMLAANGSICNRMH